MKKVIKYFLALLASLFTSILIHGVITSYISLINKTGFGAGNDSIALIIFLILLMPFFYLAYKNNNKYSIYAIITALCTAIICFSIEIVDSYFTNDFAITNGWINLFGWDEYDSGEGPMGHRVYGFSVIIFPTVLILCSLFLYGILLKKNNQKTTS